jgi:hypothetical protein
MEKRMKIWSLHARCIPASLEFAGKLLDGLAGADDRLWPHDRWPPMRLDRPLGVGAKGGHGPVRYEVVEYVPGRKVAFRFDAGAGLMRGVRGGHRWELSETPDGVELRHVIEAEGGLAPALRWHLLVRPLHDALIEDALDRAENALAGTAKPPARWSLRVRFLRRLARRKGRVKRR